MRYLKAVSSLPANSQNQVPNAIVDAKVKWC